MSFDEVACDDRMPVEAARQGRDAHPIIDPELQRLHALPNVRALPFPTLHVCVVSEAANQSERVVDVTIAVRFDQCTVFGERRGDSNLLCPPIEVDADRVGRERHERADARVRIEQALGVRIATGGGAEREQAWPVAPVMADRELRAHDDAERVAQRVQGLDAGDVAHHSERIAIDVQFAALQPRPRRHARADEKPLEASVAPLALGRVDRLLAAMARVEPAQQLVDDGLLVLLHGGRVEANNSSRHMRMVRTWRRFSSSTCATMHRGLGSSPGWTSYSKSATTIVPKFLLTTIAAPRSGAEGRDGLRC